MVHLRPPEELLVLRIFQVSSDRIYRIIVSEANDDSSIQTSIGENFLELSQSDSVQMFHCLFLIFYYAYLLLLHIIDMSTVPPKGLSN